VSFFRRTCCDDEPPLLLHSLLCRAHHGSPSTKTYQLRKQPANRSHSVLRYGYDDLQIAQPQLLITRELQRGLAGALLIGACGWRQPRAGTVDSLGLTTVDHGVLQLELCWRAAHEYLWLASTATNGHGRLDLTLSFTWSDAFCYCSEPLLATRCQPASVTSAAKLAAFY
jgi:hypothetical protein